MTEAQQNIVMIGALAFVSGICAGIGYSAPTVFDQISLFVAALAAYGVSIAITMRGPI